MILGNENPAGTETFTFVKRTKLHQKSRIFINFSIKIYMDTKDKKEDIIQTIQSTSDEQLIEEVYDLLHTNQSIENIAIQNLPHELQSKIHRAIDDYKNGRYITHDQMKHKVEQWLTK